MNPEKGTIELENSGLAAAPHLLVHRRAHAAHKFILMRQELRCKALVGKHIAQDCQIIGRARTCQYGRMTCCKWSAGGVRVATLCREGRT